MGTAVNENSSFSIDEKTLKLRTPKLLRGLIRIAIWPHGVAVSYPDYSTPVPSSLV